MIIAEVEPGKARVRFVPTAARRYEKLSVDALELDSFRLPGGGGGQRL